MCLSRARKQQRHEGALNKGYENLKANLKTSFEFEFKLHLEVKFECPQEAKAAPNGASVRCSKLHGPRTVILGDAAHGVTPALGQGCNAALESATVLARVTLLSHHPIFHHSCPLALFPLAH